MNPSQQALAREAAEKVSALFRDLRDGGPLDSYTAHRLAAGRILAGLVHGTVAAPAFAGDDAALGEAVRYVYTETNDLTGEIAPPQTTSAARRLALIVNALEDDEADRILADALGDDDEDVIA